jgi:DNA-binding LytR/AlgR family response regulator
MLNAIVIENQREGNDTFQHQLYNFPEMNILNTLTTVNQSVQYFSELTDADLIFCEVNLPDGLAFEIFRKTWVNIPIIFFSCSAEFSQKAFEHNAIDFLLKPVKASDVERAVEKYKILKEHFSKHYNSQATRFSSTGNFFPKKTKLVVKKGTENILLSLEDIVMIYTENKVVYVTDNQGVKYMSNKNLGELERELDNSIFYRTNRQYILNINYIKSFKSFETVKLKVDISVPVVRRPIIISQETATAFRKWVQEI